MVRCELGAGSPIGGKKYGVDGVPNGEVYGRWGCCFGRRWGAYSSWRTGIEDASGFHGGEIVPKGSGCFGGFVVWGTKVSYVNVKVTTY